MNLNNYDNFVFSVNYDRCHSYPYDIEYFPYFPIEYEGIFKRYFESELTGETKNILNFLSAKIPTIEHTLFLMKSERMHKNKIRDVYKCNKNLQNTKKEKKEMEQTLNTIYQQFAIIVDICSKYGLKIDEKYNNNSIDSSMLHKMQLVVDNKNEDEYNKKYKEINQSIKNAYTIIRKCINRLSRYSVCVEYNTSVVELPYTELSCEILNKIINNRIAHNIANKKTQNGNKPLVEDSQKETKEQTLMAKYLREKAMKTPDSSLTFNEYAEKYAMLYNKEQNNTQIEKVEMEQKNGRKL